MNALQNFLWTIEAFFSAILKAFGEQPKAVVSAPVSTPSDPPQPKPSIVSELEGVTADGVKAFQKICSTFLHVVEGKGTLTETEEIVNAIGDVVAILNPEDAPLIGLAEAAEPVINYLIAHMKAGVPPLTPIQPAPPLTQADWSSPTWGHDPRASNPSGAVEAGWTPPDP